MRIIFGITYYVPHISGLTLSLKPIAENLARNGNDVTVLAAQSDPDLETTEDIGGVQVERVPVALWVGKGPVRPRHFGRMSAAAKDADIVHLFLPQFDAGPAALAARLRGAKVILTYVCSFNAPGLRGAISMIAARLSHLLAGLLAHHIVALSEDYASQSTFCRLFRRKMSYIPIPIPNFSRPAAPQRAPKPPYRIGFVGRIAAEKNIGLMLDALPLLRTMLDAPFTLELVGPQDPPVSGPQRDLAQRLDTNEAPELRRLGRLSDEELDAFYRGIDVLILPSTDRIEAYGLVQVEAMMRGTPCVTSDRPGMREPIARTGFGAVFEQGNTRALAEAVSKVLSTEFSIEPESIADTFDPQYIFDAYSELYDAPKAR